METAAVAAATGLQSGMVRAVLPGTRRDMVLTVAAVDTVERDPAD